MVVGFFLLFDLSKWETYFVVLLNFGVLFGAHYLLANYVDQPRPYGSRPPARTRRFENRRTRPAGNPATSFLASRPEHLG